MYYAGCPKGMIHDHANRPAGILTAEGMLPMWERYARQSSGGHPPGNRYMNFGNGRLTAVEHSAKSAPDTATDGTPCTGIRGGSD